MPLSWLCGIFFVAGAPEAVSPSLETILIQHRQGVALCASISCDFEMFGSVEGRSYSRSSGRYLRDPQTIVLEAVPVSGVRNRTVIRNGLMTSISRLPTGQPSTWQVVIVSFDEEQGFTGDLYNEALLTVNDDGGRKGLPVADHCETHRGRLQGIRTTNEGSNRYHVVSLRFRYDAKKPDSAWVDEELWFDAGRNGLLDRSIRRYGPPFNNTRTYRVTKFAELAPGVWFPEGVRQMIASDKGESQEWISLKLKGLAVDKPIPAALLDTSIPAKAYVHDSVTGKKYRTDTDGKMIGVAEPLAQHPSLPLSPIPSGPAGAPPPVSTEPQSWSRFVFPAGAGFLLAGSVLWFVRSRRQRQS